MHDYAIGTTTSFSVLDKTVAKVVEVESMKRSAGERKFKIDVSGEEIDLDLHKTEGLLPETLPVYVFGENEDGNLTVDDWTHNVGVIVSYTL